MYHYYNFIHVLVFINVNPISYKRNIGWLTHPLAIFVNAYQFMESKINTTVVNTHTIASQMCGKLIMQVSRSNEFTHSMFSYMFYGMYAMRDSER